MKGMAEDLLPVSEAFDRVAARMPRWPVEQVSISQAAGRVLAEPVRADRDQPPFDRVMMDGIAIRGASLAAGTTRYRMEGVQAAGILVLVLVQFRVEGESEMVLVYLGKPRA